MSGTTLEHIQTETYQTHQTLPLPVLEEMPKMQTGDCTFDEVRNIIHYLRLEQHITAEFIVRRDKQQYFCHSNSNDNNISIIKMIRALVKKKEKGKRSLYCCSEKIWISSCNYISATFLVLNR